MTHDQLQSIQDDLAYMKALAQESRRAPLLGGAIMLGAGSIFGVASIVHWAIVARVLDVPLAGLTPMWLGAVALFLVALFLFKARLAGRPGANSLANRANSAAWGGLGGASGVIGAALFIATYKTGDWIFMGLFPPVILALYGAGWSVGFAMSDRRWLRTVSLGAFAAAVASAWFIGATAQYLIYAAALFLLVAAPGYALMREAPAEVV